MRASENVNPPFFTPSRLGRYVMWTLADLKDTTVNLFLFGSAYETLLSSAEGSVVALLNPAMLKVCI